MGFSLLLVIPAAAHAQQYPLTDSDGDGLPDVFETQVFHTNPSQADTNGDGIKDRDSIIRSIDPVAKGKKKLVDHDFDNDGLVDRLEIQFSTDPRNPDTDGDGYTDGMEVMNGYSPTTSEPVLLQKSIIIRLGTQRLEQRVDGIAISSFPVSTGKRSMPTPVGTFKVLDKIPRAWSSSAKLWMPYWMHFSGRGHGIHELPEWPNGRKEGAWHLGVPVSHGCVRLGVGPARLLYNWTPIGTPVTVVK